MRSCLPSGDQRACSLRAFRVNWRGAPPPTGSSQMSLSSLLVSRFFCRTVAEAHFPSGETWTSSTRRVASSSSGVKGRAASSRASNRLCMGCALYHEAKAPDLERPRKQSAWDKLEVHVVQRDVRHPGGPARRVRLRDHSADVDPVGELHAQLERSQTQVDAEDVVRRAVRPRIREGGMELGVTMPRVVLHRAVRVDYAAEVEPDHAGEPAEQRDPDQHVERELELRLADVVAVAEEPRVAPAEAAQVVEAGEEESPSEPAALRRPGGGAGEEPAAPDQLDGLDRIRLEIRVEPVGAAGGNGADAEVRQERRPADCAAGPETGGVPTVRKLHLGLRIRSADLVQLGGGEVGGGKSEAVIREVVEEAARDSHQLAARIDAAEGGERIGKQALDAVHPLQVEDLARRAQIRRGDRLEALLRGRELGVATLLESVEDADAPAHPFRPVDVEGEEIGEIE